MFLSFHCSINGHSGSAELLLESSVCNSLVNIRDAKGRLVQVVIKIQLYMYIGLWQYWIFSYRGEAATNIAVCRVIAQPITAPPPPPSPKVKKNRGRTCANAWSAAPKFLLHIALRCRATAHCSRSQISLITWRDAHSARGFVGRATLTASARARRWTVD